MLLLVINGQGCEPGAECFKDTDCIKVQTTCCPCNMGGQEECVSIALASLYEEKLKDCPPADQLICTALYNCKIKGCGCEEGICVPSPPIID